MGYGPTHCLLCMQCSHTISSSALCDKRGRAWSTKGTMQLPTGQKPANVIAFAPFNLGSVVSPQCGQTEI